MDHKDPQGPELTLSPEFFRSDMLEMTVLQYAKCKNAERLLTIFSYN